MPQEGIPVHFSGIRRFQGTTYCTLLAVYSDICRLRTRVHESEIFCLHKRCASDGQHGLPTQAQP